MKIDPKRLIGDLRELASIGQYKTGVNRPAFGAEDIAAREWLCRKMAAFGMEVSLDAVGNAYGQMKGSARALLIGSHTDTVPFGGWLDGALGVVYGLEIARCVAEAGVGELGVDVISFQDEEGTFLPFIGSRSFCGDDLAAEIAVAKNKDGEPLAPLVAKLAGRKPARLDPKRHVAYLEAHIEQGPRLESSGTSIGLVKAIVGIKTFRVVFHGEANHAGTTPMTMRRDAGAAALAFGAALAEKVPAAGTPDTVWNVGKAHFEPGAANVVPSAAELVLQVRDVSSEALGRLASVIKATAQECAASRNVTVEIEGLLDIVPAAMDGKLLDVLGQAAKDLGASSMVLPSGAGHDAMVMSRYLPSVMMFVPSINGRSHHVSENTSDEDLILGAQVMLRAVERTIKGAA